jgi:hypothetical protein
MFSGKCPLCGTGGKVWNKRPEVFRCPSCETIFSDFGLIKQTEKEPFSMWN